MKRILAAWFFLCVALVTGQAWAELPGMGAPLPGEGAWEWQLTRPASLVKAIMVDFYDNQLLWIIGGIVLFVFVMLAFILLRYNARANPNPAKFSHNVPLEIVWTIIPIVILAFIAVPSFKLLYYMDKAPGAPEVTIKVTGHQWYWEYEYQDQQFSFNANMVPDKELQAGQPRLLTTDNHIVIPVNTNVQFLVTAADVLHGFFIPPFGVNKLAIPGRVNQVWVNATHEGIYYGQCSKICGINHGYMPIMIEVVSKEAFEAWIKEAKKKYANANTGLTLASTGE
jgi:cytochrome c oxidase subunit 2